MPKKHNTSNKDSIIFILGVVLLYTWFVYIPSIRNNYKESCKGYIEEKDIDDSVSLDEYFDLDSSENE